MREFLMNSAYFGAIISLFSYFIGDYFKRKTKIALISPLLISVGITIIILIVLDIPYVNYQLSTKFLHNLLTPVTVCLAVPLYEKLQLLKNNKAAIFTGIISGIITSAFTVLLIALIFRLENSEYVTLLPKSITTAIGVGLSEKLGGMASITAPLIVITGIMGAILAPVVFRIFKISDPVAKGIALGTASHAIGTSKAFEYGETEGAMSSLSIAVSGLLTVIAAPIFATLI